MTLPYKSEWTVLQKLFSISDKLLSTEDEETESDPSFDNYSIPSLRTGLVNLGNTCYMNSALQSLFCVKEFTDFIQSRCWDLEKKQSQGDSVQIVQATPLARSLLDVIIDIRESQSTYVNPITILNEIRRKNTIFRGFYQQVSFFLF